MSKSTYTDKCDKILSRLVRKSTHKSDDEIILALTHALKTISHMAVR